MEKSTRGILLEFVKKINENAEIGQLEKSVANTLNYLMENVKDDKARKKLIEMENNILKYSDLVKYQYFDYGVFAAVIGEEIDLNWEPQGMISLLNVRTI
ncbi:hypothetical protein C4N20_15655 [Fusobacterium ulcerans]|uniref:Uncharacterized protein n=1 Tax=Fusobacterium ulcerans TaxID=861 RepID=A0AAX2JC12_9FUSO|nr:hypothetical protein [Fusobacterium ulcerans]AVQ29467.1 hypothetical protein C4N20_15655 [Fusobacterium ulcerans]EFS27035.2 hypothetical protein FUAG_02550 [Fusobacterium ulcerans ATCC 49185]SQJ03947.1 Uncharacterised protein [Fusobacterium ulcerans]